MRMQDLQAGAMAGSVATAPMSLVMALGKAAGGLGAAPPRQVTQQAGKRVIGINIRRLPEPLFKAIWLGAHLGYGTAIGAGFALARPFLPKRPFPAGLIYGEVVWAGNYLGALPALGLFPPPDRVTPSRTMVMIVAHAVYGVALALVFGRFVSSPPSTDGAG